MVFVWIILGLAILLILAFIALWIWMEGPDVIRVAAYLWEDIKDQAEEWKELFSPDEE